MQIKLKNIPIPEVHIIGTLLGVLLRLFFKTRNFLPAWIGHLAGWPLIFLGASLSIWAVIEAGVIDVSSPEKLVTSGPFAFSRNPMYVGWTLIYLGICLVVNSVWFLILFPLVAIYIHFVEIPKEERMLEQRFGNRYRDYREQVGRYL